jgi:hypothetical protein
MGLLNPNLTTLEATAKALEPILEDLVFVGGTIAGLLINDPGASSARPTRDVDVVAQITGFKDHLRATKMMGEVGFQPDTRQGAPMCRWVKDGLMVDLMGTEDTPLGATNPWYAEGFRTRFQMTLSESGVKIYILPAPIFLLTKWVAYLGRGKGSMAASHDIEDILNVLDGRLGLAREAMNASPEVRSNLAQMAHQMLASQQFCDHCLESLGRVVTRSSARAPDI